ncbi:unnamed protein product [Lupinus luteus]|uniref:Uncharacterized protein n=1 Tax=Lupinus luteus TaxID=3873 RepID=A0AAV1WW89_LUPLU
MFERIHELSKDICILDSSLPLQSRLLKSLLAYIEHPSRYSPLKSGGVVEPSDLDHDEFMKVKSSHMKIVRSGNKRGRGTHDKGRGNESLRNMYEEWVDDDEKRSPMSPNHIGPSTDVSNSTEDFESDDNGQAVEYDQGNWEIGLIDQLKDIAWLQCHE